MALFVEELGVTDVYKRQERIHGKDEVAGSIPATSIEKERSLEKI